MKPEWAQWVTAGLGILQLVTLIVTLKIRAEFGQLKQDILDRVANDYQLTKVCEAKMGELKAELRPAKGRA